MIFRLVSAHNMLWQRIESKSTVQLYVSIVRDVSCGIEPISTRTAADKELHALRSSSVLKFRKSLDMEKRATLCPVRKRCDSCGVLSETISRNFSFCAVCEESLTVKDVVTEVRHSSISISCHGRLTVSRRILGSKGCSRSARRA